MKRSGILPRTLFGVKIMRGSRIVRQGEGVGPALARLF